MLKVCHVCGQKKEHASPRSTTCNDCLSVGFKWCTSCKQAKEVDAFYTNGKCLRSSCVSCVNNDRRLKRSDAETRRIMNEQSRISHYKLYHNDEEFKARRILKSQIHQSNRRAQGSITKEDWQHACEAFCYSCAYCGAKVSLTVEHVVPIDKGGTSAINNIIPVCHHCNSSKSNKDLMDWYTKQSFYSKDRLESIIKYIKGVTPCQR